MSAGNGHRRRCCARVSGVIGVDQRMPGGNLRRLQDQARFELVVAPLQDGDLARHLRGVTKVFHLAAATNVQDSWGAGFSDHAISTVLGTHRLLSACGQAEVPRVVVASSSHVYGMAAGLAREDAPLSPMSPYGWRSWPPSGSGWPTPVAVGH